MRRVALIGELDGPPEYAFGQVIAIEARADSSFFACDFNDTSIRLYDARGTFVRPVGQMGAGPGEYRSCRFMSEVGDSVLWIGDSHNGRFVAFGRELREAGVVVGGEHSNPQLVDVAGRFWWLRASPDYRKGMDLQEYVLTNRSLHALDTVAVPPRLFGAKHPRAFVLSTAEGTYRNVANDTVWSISRDGALLRAHPHEYRVTRRGGSRPPLEIKQTATTVEYVDAERAEWEQWRTFNTERWSGVEGQRLEFDPPSTHKPLIRAVREDDLGRIWVQVHVRAERRDIPPRPAGNRTPLLTWRERNTYDLFGESGAYIGRVAFPYATQLMASRGDRVWLLEEGESGEQLVGIYDLVPARR